MTIIVVEMITGDFTVPVRKRRRWNRIDENISDETMVTADKIQEEKRNTRKKETRERGTRWKKRQHDQKPSVDPETFLQRENPSLTRMSLFLRAREATEPGPKCITQADNERARGFGGIGARG